MNEIRLALGDVIIGLAVLVTIQPAFAQGACPQPSADAYLNCLKGSRNLEDAKPCIPLLRIDLGEIDAWVMCELEAAEAQYTERRKAVLQRAASRRSALNTLLEFTAH